MAVSSPSALESALAALASGQNRDPFAVLGPHPDERGRGTRVRAFLPSARSVDLVLQPAGDVRPMERRDPDGVFEAVVGDRFPGQTGGNLSPSEGNLALTSLDYRLRVTYPGDHVIEIDDPYRYGRVLTDYDLNLLGEGTHYRSFEKLGA